MMSIPFGLERSIVIDKPSDVVFTFVSRFDTWRDWSPWLSQEPESEVQITGDPGRPGHRQAWKGEKIGAGHQELVRVEKDLALDYDLVFLKPWKSRSKAGFTFEALGAGTRVTWSMEGTLPLPLFFMKKKMAAMVGSDYERGLALLKTKLES